MFVSRARALAILGATALLPFPTRSTAQPAPTIRLADSPVDSFAEPFFGVDSGVFQGAGLNVDLDVTTAILPAMLANEVDVGVGDVIQVADMVNSGLPIAVFAAGGLYSTNAPTTLFCVAKNGSVREAKDLEGQAVGVILISNLGALAVREWMRQNKVNLESVRFVEIPFASMTAALERGTIAGAMIPEPFLSEAGPDIRVLAKAYDAIAKSFYISCFFATREWLTKNADTAKRFELALYEAGRWANTHRDASASILAKYAKIDVDRIRSMTRVAFATSLDESHMQPVLDVSYRSHLLTKPVNATDLIVRL